MNTFFKEKITVIEFDFFRSHDQSLLNRIVQRGKIFARMLPEQKIHLIECLKDLG